MAIGRAYKIKDRIGPTETIVADDFVTTTLDLLPILPRERMADLVRTALGGRGFTAGDDGVMTRERGGVGIAVDPADGSVMIRAQDAQEHVHADHDDKGSGSATCCDPCAERARESLREGLRERLSKEYDQHVRDLQTSTTRRLEAAVVEIHCELERVTEEVLEAALLEKAATMGEVRDVARDADGTVSIRVALAG